MENQVPQTQEPTSTQSTPPQQTRVTPAIENKSSVGGIIGTIIIIALIILGGLYFWGKRIEESRTKQVITSEYDSRNTSSSSEAAVIKSTSSSDDLDSIDADVKSTNTSNLDSELQ